MGEVLSWESNGWGTGVNTAVRPDLLPPTASPYGLNSALTDIGGGMAVVKKRDGIAARNTTAVTGAAAIEDQLFYRKLVGGATTRYHLFRSALRLDRLNDDNTLTTVSATAFTSSTYNLDYEVANNLCFIVNGTDAIKYDGTNLTTFGITRPTVGTMAAADGGAGAHSGTYELRVTYGNSNTGTESSASDTASSTVTVTDKTLSWSNIPVSADAQVDRRYLYIRNTSTMVNFYRVATISNNTDTTATTSIADAVLTTIAPGTSDHNPPPADARYLAWYQSRLFVATPTHVYYSSLGHPENFYASNYEQVNPDDGQEITGLMATSTALLIFKSDSVWGLFGDDPQSWEVRPLIIDLGCVSHRSIVNFGGFTYWWSKEGAVRWSGEGEVQMIGAVNIPTVMDSIYHAEYKRIGAAVDITNQRIIWTIPTTSGSARNTLLLPWSAKLGCWESVGWDPMDAASLCTIEDSLGAPQVVLGNYAGLLFTLNSDTIDGVPSGDTSYTLTATADDLDTTVSLPNASLYNSLIERKVDFYNSAGTFLARRTITAHNYAGGIVTLDAAVSDLVQGGVYTLYFGAPRFIWDSAWVDFGKPFVKKRWEFLYVQTASTTAEYDIDINLLFNGNTGNEKELTASFTTSLDAGYWAAAATDREDDWDQLTWAEEEPETVLDRLRIGKTGHSMRIRCYQGIPDEPVTLLKLSCRAEALTDKA